MSRIDEMAMEQMEKLLRKSMSGEPITTNELMRISQAQHLSITSLFRSTIDAFKSTTLEGLEKVFTQAREDRKEHQEFQAAEFRRINERIDKQEDGLRAAISHIQAEAKADRVALQASLASQARFQFAAYIVTLVVLAALGGAGVAVNAGWLSASSVGG